jgi:LmbE family N-acetylglucosaminyl deacetylase
MNVLIISVYLDDETHGSDGTIYGHAAEGGGLDWSLVTLAEDAEEASAWGREEA